MVVQSISGLINMTSDEVVRRKIGIHIRNKNTSISWELYFAKVCREKMYQNQLRHCFIPPTLQIVVYHTFGNCSNIKILTASHDKDSNSIVMLMVLIVHTPTPTPHPTPHQPYLIWIYHVPMFVFSLYATICCWEPRFFSVLCQLVLFVICND